MGLSFHDQPTMAEAVSSLRCAVHNPNPSISQDGTSSTLHNAIPAISIREDDDIGRSDDIQMVDR